MTRSIHLEIGAQSSHNFLRLWQAWRNDPQRPAMLHGVAVCATGYSNSPEDAEEAQLKPLAEQLDAQLWGLLPGFHRLVFEGGQVLLTLCIGDVVKALKQQQFEADSVYLHADCLANAEPLHLAKALARLCKPGTELVSQSSPASWQAALKQCGFVVDEHQSVYNPSWTTKAASPGIKPATCVVIGAGLAGAAVAGSLARRGWQVTVLDAAQQPASGASSLPAGLLVAHTSPDDSPLSRLSRSGVRSTLQQARAALRHGTDWGHTGVLQRSFDGEALGVPPAWSAQFAAAASHWCYPASARTLAAAGLPATTQALWHAQAGWVRPAALVNAWLAAPGVQWLGGQEVAHLTSHTDGWQARSANGAVLAQAELVVLCAGYASQALAVSAGAAAPGLQAIRGQVTFGLQNNSDPLPPFAVNGHGGLIPAVSSPQGPMWLMGAGYQRDECVPELKAQDHLDNLARLQRLLPAAAVALADQFSEPLAQGWAGIRCATPNRLPLLGRIPTSEQSHGLWACTGMGSRGLSFAALCGELLAAQLHGEPLPVESALAQSMSLGLGLGLIKQPQR